jgi:hypothetical protein
MRFLKSIAVICVAVFTPSLALAQASRLKNISTRAYATFRSAPVIAGFIIPGVPGGPPKRVAIVATGPSLAAHGVTNPLPSTYLVLVDPHNYNNAYNHDWQTTQGAAELQTLGLAPPDAHESALIRTLPPGTYTAHASGRGDSSGTGGDNGTTVIAVYEVDRPDVPLINISTRARMLGGNDAMIAGFVIEGIDPMTVAIVATGPSLGSYGVTDPLPNPTLKLVRQSDETVMALNDDWQTAGNAAQLQSAGYAPPNVLEAGILITLAPGAYTAIVGDAGGATGSAVVGVYAVP